MMRIEFNRHELLICELMGTVRRKNAMQFNADRQVSNQNPYDMDIDGFMGEFAVAKYLNVMVDTTINEKKNPVDIIWNGHTIDVKTTRNTHANIHVTEYHRKSPCDIYIQVIIDKESAILSGWVDSNTLFEKAEYLDNDHPSYRLQQKHLFHIAKLKEYGQKT